MSRPIGAKGTIEEFETEVFRDPSTCIFEVRRCELDEGIERAGTEFKNFEETRSSVAPLRGGRPGQTLPRLDIAGLFSWLERPALYAVQGHREVLSAFLPSVGTGASSLVDVRRP
jgi:hypothetical protein